MGVEARGEREDWVVPFEMPKARIPDASHFRSTWLTASQQTIRERGLGAQYEAALDPQHKDAIVNAVAGVWLPMEQARAHYLACNSLGFTTQQMFEIGLAATRRANATTLQFAVRLAQGAGVTPWTILEQSPRLWDRTCRGGAVAVARLGPKEARVEVVGYPLADIPYNRVTFRGIVAAVVELFCQKAYVKELASLCDARSLGMRLSWV